MDASDTAVGEPIITLDVDWAPDYQIDAVIERLVERGVKATWFVTHESPALARLRREPELFEVGIHPNFMAGSSHGGNPREVMEFCRELAPESVSMRTHGLLQSTHIFQDVFDVFPQRVDASLYLSHAADARPIDYYWMGHHMTRLPTVWEDDLETMRPDPIWDCAELLRRCRGLAVLSFHPIHVLLNTRDIDVYRRYKELRSQGGVQSLEEIAELVDSADGAATMFESALEWLVRTGGGRRLRDVADEHAAQAGR